MAWFIASCLSTGVKVSLIKDIDAFGVQQKSAVRKGTRGEIAVARICNPDRGYGTYRPATKAHAPGLHLKIQARQDCGYACSHRTRHVPVTNHGRVPAASHLKQRQRQRQRPWPPKPGLSSPCGS
ncbi:hypothetical protein ACNPM8_00220 [Glutamicibacter sp. AGC46]